MLTALTLYSSMVVHYIILLNLFGIDVFISLFFCFHSSHSSCKPRVNDILTWRPAKRDCTVDDLTLHALMGLALMLYTAPITVFCAVRLVALKL